MEQLHQQDIEPNKENKKRQTDLAIWAVIQHFDLWLVHGLLKPVFLDFKAKHKQHLTISIQTRDNRKAQKVNCSSAFSKSEIKSLSNQNRFEDTPKDTALE